MVLSIEKAIESLEIAPTAFICYNLSASMRQYSSISSKMYGLQALWMYNLPIIELGGYCLANPK